MRLALRATRVLAQKPQISSDPFTYHTQSENSLWEKVRKAVVVNASSSGNPLPSAFRQPEPGSRPEKFTVPSSKASDVAENPYYKRDFRRQYPKTEFVTQDELAKLLIAQGGFESLPPIAAETSSSTAITADTPTPSLASLYNSSSAVATASFRPPVPPGLKFKWVEAEEVIPHDPQSYFPMVNMSSVKL